MKQITFPYYVKSKSGNWLYAVQSKETVIQVCMLDLFISVHLTYLKVAAIEEDVVPIGESEFNEAFDKIISALHAKRALACPSSL